MRSRWPDLQFDDEEPESTAVENEGENEIVNYCIQKNKDQNVSIIYRFFSFIVYIIFLFDSYMFLPHYTEN